ncbi:MAG: ATP-binding protein [Gemmatimonadaceae bacterium]
MSVTRRMDCDARQDQLPAMLQFVTAACGELGLPEDVAFDVRLAVEEACTNIVMHGYRGGAPGPVSIEMMRDEDRVVVTIRDSGVAFHPEAVAPPRLRASVEERALGGLGWHLIKSTMDHVQHEHDPETGNTLTLVKHIPGAGA